MKTIKQLLSHALILVFYMATTMHNTFAAEVENVTALTDSILVIVFDDGYIDYHTLGGSAWGNDVAHASEVNLENAMNTLSYSLSSVVDEDYSIPLHPSAVSR